MNFQALQNQMLIFNLSVSFEIISFATHIIFALLIVFVHLPTITLIIPATVGKPLQLWCVVILTVTVMKRPRDSIQTFQKAKKPHQKHNQD